MQKIIDFINSAIVNYHIDISIIQNVQVCLGKEMKVDDWISLVLSNGECVVLLFDNGIFINEGFVVNDEKVLKVYGLLLYKGIMINWKRFGYGTSYHDNGMKEYEGYWCDDNRFGSGKVYDRHSNLVNECFWVNGIENDIKDYEGDGSEPMNIGIKHLKLTDNCVLVDWDVSWLLNLESIEIGYVCFALVKTFKIDGLNGLKTIKIGNNSFTQKKNSCENNESKSFHILNCESLESIQIGEYSFSDYAGEFELKNLPQLQSIQIGTIGSKSNNFYYSSFVIAGIELILNI